MTTIRLTNDLWEVEISPEFNGRVVRLVDRADGAVRVQAPDFSADVLAEGGRLPPFGLECWTKAGDQVDQNTGVLSTFASIFRQPLAAVEMSDGVRLEARHAGLLLAIEWRLPEGSHPLHCRLTLTNEAATVDDFQFENFFIWHVPDAEWLSTGIVYPGHDPIAPKPYGEISFLGGAGDGCAAWWTRNTSAGVVLRGVEGIQQYFSGVSGAMFVMGPHSKRQRLAPGDVLSATFEIAPLCWAQAQGWAIDIPAAEATLAAEDAQTARQIARIGSLSEWTKPASVPFERRAFHITVQYGPNDLRRCIKLLEDFVAPAGYNQLLVEVDRAFPFRSHPKLTPEWAWNRGEWDEFLNTARSLGLELIPLYNALAHQGESAITAAYPEMREDAGGWCICPQHPHTQQYLGEIFDELAEAFTPHYFHIGLDEVDMPSRPQCYCTCPICREADGGVLFANHINGLYDHLAGRGMEVMMWADMLLYREEHNTINGLRTGTWKAIDQLPREIIMVDWVYTPVEAYGGTDYLLEQGYRVMGATWHMASVLPAYCRYAVERELFGMCQTTWSDVSVREWPMLVNLMAAKYFQNPLLENYEEALDEAKALATKLARMG